MRWDEDEMAIKHHLSDALIWAYAVGELPEAFNLVIATHISMCDTCRAQLETLDAVGGAVLDGCDAVPLDDDALEQTMARLGSRMKEPIRADFSDRDVFPTPLREYAGGDLADVAWRPVGGGVRQAILTKSDGASARLLSIPAGVAMPDHGHRGVELTLVLQGAFADDTDRFARGDIEVATEEDEHSPVAQEGETCICLAATDAPLRFTSLIPRLAQSFLRI